MFIGIVMCEKTEESVNLHRKDLVTAESLCRVCL